MVVCSIRNCKSKSIKGGEIRFFTFPKKESVANEWLRYCGRKTTVKHGRVCSNHFLPSDYFKSLQHILLNESPRKVRQLKPDALPTLSMPIEVNSQIVDSSGNLKTTADTLAVDNKNKLSEITLKKNAGKCRRYRERKKAEVQQLLSLNNDQEPPEIILKKKQNAEKSRRFREQQRRRFQQQKSTFIQEHNSPFEEIPPTPASIRQIKLHQESTENFKEDIINGDELQAEHINNFQDIIASQFLNLRPIDVQLIALPQLVRPISHLQKHLQILSGVSAQVNQTTHWICMYYDGYFINVYDSLNMESLYPEIVSILNQLLPHKPQHKFHKVRQQLNDTDSGVYAIAFATSILNNRDPSKENYDHPKMRSHLLDIYNTTELLPFPIEPSPDALRKRKKNKVQFQYKEHSAAALHKRKIRVLKKLETQQSLQNLGEAQPLTTCLTKGDPTDSSSKSSSSQLKMPAPIRHTPFIKSESQDIKQDPDSDDTVSLDDEEDPPSEADQPFEDMMPLSNVPLTNVQDPLSEVKKEVPDVPPEGSFIKVEEVEVTGPEEEETCPEEEEMGLGEEENGLGEEETDLGEEETGSGDEESLLREEVTVHVKEDWVTKLLRQKVAKLTARLTVARRKMRNMAKILKRRDNTIRRLRAERDIVGRGGTVGGTRAGRIQIQSTNNTAKEMIPNRKVVVIKSVPNRSEQSAKIQRMTSANIGSTSPAIQDTTKNVGDKRTLNIVERSSLGIQNTSGILYKTLTGVKRTADVRIQKSPVSGQHTSDNRQKPSIVVQPLSDAVKTPTFVIQPNSGKRQISSVSSSVQNTSDKRKKMSIVVKPMSAVGKRPILIQPKSEIRKISSIGAQQTSVNRPKPIVIKRLSCIKNPKIVVQPKSVTRKMSVDLQSKLENRQKSSLVVQPTSDDQPTSSLVVQPSSDNRTVSSLVVQPTSDDRPKSSLAVQRTSDIRQNSLVIQIDGMHNTVLQPKLVRLADKQTEMET